jgi:uncharacterized protein (DUF952 family)
VIFHIATADDWESALAEGREYEPPSLRTEGFVHCSLASQVAGTLAGWFAGRDDLVLLQLDPASFGDRLMIEAGSRGERERFPHIYASIPLEAVVAATPLELDVAGTHQLPATLPTASID